MRSVPFFSLRDIEQDLDEVYFERGLAYQQEGRILRLESIPYKKDQWKIKSVIRGSGKSLYHTDIIVKPKGNAISIDGYCSCPMDYNCKHVAASLIEAVSQKNSLQNCAWNCKQNRLTY